MRISSKAILIGIVAVALVCVIVSYAELLVMYIQIGFLQLPPVVIAMLAFLLLAGAAAKKISSRLGLSPQELMTIYCMMLMGSMISSRGLMEKLIALLVTPDYFANEPNNWRKLFFPHIKKWMVPFDPDPTKTQAQWISQRFYERLREGEHLPWGQWIGPLAMWAILALLIFGAFLCLAAILRRQWVDNEKLSFPLAQLPLEMVREERAATFFRSPLTWMGFALPAAVFMINGLHNWMPNVPQFVLHRTINEFLVNPPWNSLYYTPFYLSFAAIGFLYLLPSEVLFSLWFFFVFARLEGIALASRGMILENMPIYPCHLVVGYQAMGAYFVLAAYLFWVSRPHIKKVIRSALNPREAEDKGELMPYRTALIGLLICFIGSAVWMYAAGLSLWFAVFELVIYIFVIALVMARSTAEAGLLMTETSFRPIDVYRLFAPTSSLGAANLTVLSFLDAAFLRDQRGLVLTGFLDGLKITDGVGLNRRKFIYVFVGAILLAMLVAGALQLWMPYHYGALTMYTYPYVSNNLWGFQDYAPAMSGQTPRLGWQAPTFLGVGIVLTVFLAFMRATASWWPFHPLGLALAGSWTMIVFWFPCLIAWILKTIFLRYGGMRFYVRARPFFLGMILGEFCSAVLWTVISATTRIPAPEFPWP